MRFFKSTYIIVFLLIFCAWSTSHANSPSSVITQFQGESIILMSQQKVTTPMQVRLIDLEGKILLSENLELQSFTKNYNLKNLPNGSYNLEISNDYEILIKTVSIDERVISFISEEVTYKPHFFIKGKTCTISLLSFGNKATIEVVDESGAELFTETIKDQNSISRKYDFSTARIGQYNLNIFYEGQVYSQKVNIFI